jgi:hypothetical protein
MKISWKANIWKILQIIKGPIGFFTSFAINYSPYSYQAARRNAVGCDTAV